jgi:hypothetical protein
MRPKGYTASIRENGELWDNDHKKRRGWPIGTKKWSVTLKNPEGKTMSFQFHTGPAYGRKPGFDDVVGDVISTTHSYENNPDLEGFCRESGYDPEDKEAQRIFVLCKDMAERARVFFGDDFDAMAEHTEDL